MFQIVYYPNNTVLSSKIPLGAEGSHEKRLVVLILVLE